MIWLIIALTALNTWLIVKNNINQVNNNIRILDEIAESETRTRNRIDGFLQVFQKSRDLR